MTALIELVCRTHLQPNALGPLVTIVDGRWAYCEQRADSEHDWVRIEPTRRGHLGDISGRRPRGSVSPGSRVDEEVVSLDSHDS